MGIDTSKLCFGCFSEKSTEGPCLKCGFDIATAKHPAIALPIGTILNGRYLTGRVLGVGGFGVTYLALDMTLETSVAVKEYLPSGIAIRDNDHYTMTVSSQDEQEKFNNGANKFLEEARILAKLRTVPNIVTVHDYFRENGTAYFVMEYIEGVDLLRYAYSKGGKLSFEETRDLMLPIMKSLGIVHEHNLLHRDISPDNIIVTKNKTTHLLDFGAARLAIDSEKSKSIILKHGFAPEEQYRKHGNQGPWSDEYALAATMYLIMTGVMPPDAIERVHEDTLEAPSKLGISIPKYAEDALLKALAIHASERFPDMASFAEAIKGKNAQPSAVVAAAAAPAAVTAAQPSPFASAQTAPSPFKPAPAAPVAPVAPAAQSAFRPVPAANASAARPIPVPVTPQSAVSYGTSVTPAKKSIWKKPLTYVIAGIILVAGIAAPVTYFALKNKKSDEEITETTKKRTSKTTADTTDDTTDEPTDTPTDTIAPTDTTASINLSTINYTIEDLSYDVTSEWINVDQNGYQYFFPSISDSDNFMSVYALQSVTKDQAPYVDFDEFMAGFTSEVTSGKQFQNAQITSSSINKDSNLNYSDLTMTCEYQGQAKELVIHVILDKETGMSYVYMMCMKNGLGSSERQGFVDRFNASIASITKKGGGSGNPTDSTTAATLPANTSVYTLGDITYAVNSDWQYVSQSGYHYFFKDPTDAENFMMVYQMNALTPSQAAEIEFDDYMDEFNMSMTTSADFKEAEIESTSTNTDSDLNYGDTIMTCKYQGKAKEIAFRVVLDKTTGKTYIFMMYMDDGLSDARRSDYLGTFYEAVGTVTRN